VLHPIAEGTDDGFKRNIRHALYLAKAFKHGREGDFCFQTSQGSTKAEMDAVAEGEMAVWVPPNIESVGMRKLCLFLSS
jgi:hypothetical protein